MEELPDNKNQKKKPGYDDYFKGHAEDVLPKTTPETPEMKKILEKANNYEDEIKRIQKDVTMTLSQTIKDSTESSKEKSAVVILEYSKQFKDLEEQSKLLPKWQAYVAYEKTVPNSIQEFEKTTRGTFLRLKTLFFFGTERTWWDKAIKEINQMVDKSNALYTQGMYEREIWIAPRKQKLIAEKFTKLENIYGELLSRDVSAEAIRLADEKKEMKKKIRNPKNPENN